MNKKIANRWISALRSGKYKQNYDALGIIDIDNKKERSYCCLGVLCELAIKSKINVKRKIKRYKIYYNNKLDIAPPIVRDWAGFKDDDSQLTLSRLNDGYIMKKSMSFKQIANYIGRHVDEL